MKLFILLVPMKSIAFIYGEIVKETNIVIKKKRNIHIQLEKRHLCVCTPRQ